MSIIHELSPFHNREGQCFYCGRALSIDTDLYLSHDQFTVYWDGYKSGEKRLETIKLHPRCAQVLAMHLIKDVRSGEIELGKKTY